MLSLAECMSHPAYPSGHILLTELEQGCRTRLQEGWKMLTIYQVRVYVSQALHNFSDGFQEGHRPYVSSQQMGVVKQIIGLHSFH